MSVGAVLPAGYHSVTPRMVVSDVAAAAGFLREVFGATGEPWETPYGDRRAMVRDPSGNMFQIASRADAGGS
jgi:uncharacterized glyoxalase superfamily protein PhnB